MVGGGEEEKRAETEEIAKFRAGRPLFNSLGSKKEKTTAIFSI